MEVDALQAAFVAQNLLEGVYRAAVMSVTGCEGLHDKPCPNQVKWGKYEPGD